MFILRFLKLVLANCLALAIFCVGLFLIIIAFTAGIIASVAQKEPGDLSGVLVIDLASSITDYSSSGEFKQAFAFSRDEVDIYTLTSALKKAAHDDKIKAVLLYGSTALSRSSITLASASELREALKSFKSGGKCVYAYLENPSQFDYYIASVSDEIILNPAGDFTFKGLDATSIYFGNAFKKYGVGVQVVKCGEFKNFADMLTSDKMSEEDRAHMEELLSDIWESVVRKIAASRNLKPSELFRTAEESPFLDAQEALKANLADKIFYKDELVDAFKEKFGEDSWGESFLQVSLFDYLEFLKKSEGAAHGFASKTAYSMSENHIALVYMNGEIVDGGSGAISKGIIDAEYYAQLLQQLRNDEAVRAVVLRIDSPGGSAYASEVIRREVEKLASQKPLVVSFGSLGASGAYWIASASGVIIAEEESIVGSIGVIGVLFSFDKIAADYGVTFDSVKVSKFADIFTVARPKTALELAKYQGMVDKIYSNFVALVSKSRNIPLEETKKLANGRVFAARRAQKLKLIDDIGGIAKALETVSEQAELGANFRVVTYPQHSLAEILLGLKGKYFSGVLSSTPEEYLLKEYTMRFKAVMGKNGVSARMPFDIKINQE